MRVVEAEIGLTELEVDGFEEKNRNKVTYRNFLKRRKAESNFMNGSSGGGALVFEKNLILKVEYKKTGKTTGEIIMKYFGLVT